MAKDMKVIGAGLVGSLLSCYLAKAGHKVTVYERRSDMRKRKMSAGRSINLALSRRGWKALERVGIKEKIEEIAIPMHGRMIHSVDGELELQPYGREGQAIYSVSRGELNKQLMQIAEDRYGVEYHFDMRCEDIEFDRNEIHFEDENDQLHKVNYDLVFGADGAFSAARTAVMHDSRFNYSQQYLEHGYQEYNINPRADGGFKMEKEALHIWPRKSFMLIALPNPDGSFTLTLFAAFKGRDSFEELETLEGARKYFEKHFPDALALMDDTFEDSWNENPVSSLVTVRCSPWVHKNCLLIGDAAHAIVPFYGQGMNSGFEDCRVLDDIMEAHGDDWGSIMDTYNQLRKPDGDAIAQLALNNFIEMRDLVSDPYFIAKKQIEKVVIDRIRPDYLPLYSQVTFSDLRYSEAFEQGQKQNEMLFNLIRRETADGHLDVEQVERLAREYAQALETA